MYRYFREKEINGILGKERLAGVDATTDPVSLSDQHSWLGASKLAVKPDQLLKRRGINNLLALDVSYEEALSWIKKYMNKNLCLDNANGCLTHFILEPFIPHAQEDEYYVCIQTTRWGDQIMFHSQGGIHIGEVEGKARKLMVKDEVSIEKIAETLLQEVPEGSRNQWAQFIQGLYQMFAEWHFTYLEINPVVMVEGKIIPLDMAAKLDDAARFLMEDQWEMGEFPVPFGREASPEENKIAQLDEKSGASLKFTLLKPDGRIWLLIAGGGASVVYADTVADKGYGHELGNYGEYSGDPDEELTYEYTCTLLDLMTRKKLEGGKVLLIGGGIANFTDVAATFKGIIRALRTYEPRLREHEVSIYVRRGGPNYRQGLEMMKDLGVELGIPIDVYGPETHMTEIVNLAIGNLEPVA